MDRILWSAYHMPGMSDVMSIISFNPLKNIMFNICRRENEVLVSNVTQQGCGRTQASQP